MTTSLSDKQRMSLKMAAQWFATLCADEVTPQQNQKWQQWLAQDEDHRWAWQRVEALQGQLHNMPGKFSYQTLDHARQQSDVTRRRVLKSLLVLLGLGGELESLAVACRAGVTGRYTDFNRRNQNAASPG